MGKFDRCQVRVWDVENQDLESECDYKFELDTNLKSRPTTNERLNPLPSLIFIHLAEELYEKAWNLDGESQENQTLFVSILIEELERIAEKEYGFNHHIWEKFGLAPCIQIDYEFGWDAQLSIRLLNRSWVDEDTDEYFTRWTWEASVKGKKYWPANGNRNTEVEHVA